MSNKESITQVKTCNRCRKEKPVEDFGRNSSTKNAKNAYANGQRTMQTETKKRLPKQSAHTEKQIVKNS
jgi:hypothetical protein